MIDLPAIESRYERLANLAEEDARAATTACAVAYSIDVPALIAEVTVLQRQNAALQADNEIYAAEARAMDALAKRMEQ